MSSHRRKSGSFSSPKATRQSISSSTFKSPRTPKTPRSAKTVKSPRTPKTPQPMKIPDDWVKQSALVFHKRDENLNNPDVKANSTVRRRGVWTSEYNVKSPSELWLFPHGQEPIEIHHSKYDAFGVWGYKPGVDEETCKSPRDFWFYPPKAKVPSFFQSLGLWTFPYVKPETAHIAPDSAGFVDIGVESVKMRKLDVGGQWKLLYQKDGLPPVTKKKINLKVRTWKNEIIPLEDCRTTDTIDAIKQRVQDIRPDLPKNIQSMYHDGEYLESAATVNDYSIPNNGVIDLEGMQIYVQLPDNGKRLLLAVDGPGTTIHRVKETVQEKESIPASKQKLSFGGQSLEHSPKTRTLKDYKIKHLSTLDLDLDNPKTTLYVQEYGNERKLPIEGVKPTQTVGDTMNQIERQHGIPKRHQRLAYNNKTLKDKKKSLKDYKVPDGATLKLLPMQITVVTPDGKKKIDLVGVKPTSTVAQIKQMVNDEDPTISVNDQRLEFRGEPLDKDKKTLEDCGIPNGATLDLSPMQLFVRNDETGKTFPIHDPSLSSRTTVKELKQMIEDQENIPFKDQKLLTPVGKELTQQDKPLSYFDVKHGDTLSLTNAGMEITVVDWQNNTYELKDLQPTTTIDEVKGRIENYDPGLLKRSMAPIPKKHQRLFYQSKELLDNNKTLKQYRIPNKAQLRLGGMEITVRDEATNRTVPISNLHPSETVDDVQAQIERKLGTPKDQQRLLHNGKPLKSGPSTLDDNGIKHGTTLDLEGMKVHVVEQKPVRKKLTLNVKPTDTLSSLQKLVQEETNVPRKEQRLVHQGSELLSKYDPKSTTLEDSGIQHNDTIYLEGMQIHVNTPSGEKLTLDVRPSNTIDDVKRKVQNKAKIPKEEQRLVYRKKELDNDYSTLEDNKIQHGATLDLEGMQIFVTPSSGNGKPMPLDVKPVNTVDEVKKKLEKQYGIPMGDQRLHFKGKPLDENGPSQKTLEDHGIKHGSTLNLQGMQIIIKDWTNKQFTLDDVAPTDTIMDIKEKISEIRDIPVDVQFLSFNRKSLDKDSNTLSDHRIRHKSELDLERMKIYVKTWNEKTFPLLDVRPGNTILDIKKMIEKKEGVVPDNQYLIHGGKLLDDGPTLRDYNIRHKATINLERMKIYVKTWSGKTFTLDVDPDSTVLDVKNMITTKENIRPKDQQLRYNDEVMKDEPTLRDYSVKYKSTLNLEQRPKEEPAKKKTAKPVPVSEAEDEEELEPVPTFRVRMDDWQDPFAFSPKGRSKKDGVRARKGYSSLADFYGTAKNTSTAPFKPVLKDGPSKAGKKTIG